MLEEFLYNYNLSVYSIEILKKLADSLNQSECYIAVMHLYFEKACAVGSYELVAYILEHCENLVPEHHELRPYKELFLAYLAAKERDQEFNSLVQCFDLLQQYQRIEPDKYALYLACLFRKKETASLLLNHPDIDPNCLYLIMNERDSFDFDPAGLADSNLSESLIGWIVAADVDGSIGDSLLKIAERLESELILDLLCCKILVALRKSDSESLINALKSFAALDRVFFRENYLLAALFGEMGSRQMDVKPVMSYMVNDDSYNWAAKLEKIDEDELDNLFSDSNAKLACDMIGVLLAAPQFYPFMLELAKGCCLYQEGLTTFRLVCSDNIKKLSIEEIQQNLVLPLLECFEHNPEIIRGLRVSWAATAIFPEAKLLLEDCATNYPAFFQSRRKAGGEVNGHWEQNSFEI